VIPKWCETLDPDELRLLVELDAPFADRHGSRRWRECCKVLARRWR